MSWLNASKSYTNWTIKELLNGENVFLSFLPVKVNQIQRNFEVRPDPGNKSILES